MTELIYHVAITADHFIAGPNGEADESIFRHDGEFVADFLNSVKQYDTVLMGRKTYEFGFQFGMKPGERSGVAMASNPEMKHYIFSQMLDFKSNEYVELVREDVVGFVTDLKKEDNKKIWICGGGQLAGTLLDAELIDKLILKVNPVIIGRGVPLFGESHKKVRLNLLDFKSFDSGIIVPTYRIEYN